jgi:hypothetical protein
MDKFKETFFKSMEHFRRIRIKTLEKHYDQTVRTHTNQRDFESVHDKLLEIIGEQNKPLLIELVDLAVAQYNTDSAWFYDKGFQDCQSTYGLFRSILKNVDTIPPLQEKCNAELEEEINELINT